MQTSTQRLHNHQFDACATVQSTLVWSSIRQLLNRRIDACAAVDSILVQLSLNRRFGARFQTLMCMSFRTWIQFIFSYFTSYLDTLYYRDKFQKLKNYWWRITYLNRTITNLNKTATKCTLYAVQKTQILLHSNRSWDIQYCADSNKISFTNLNKNVWEKEEDIGLSIVYE